MKCIIETNVKIKLTSNGFSKENIENLTTEFIERYFEKLMQDETVETDLLECTFSDTKINLEVK